MRATADRSHPGDQLAHAERLGQVVIGAELQAGNAVALGAARREHQDGDGLCLRIAAQLATDGQPVEIGEVEVEDDEIEPATLHFHERVMPAAELRNGVALALEIEADGECQVGIVFDESDSLHPFLSMPVACLIVFPSTRYTTISQMFVAASAMRSKYLPMNVSRMAREMLRGSSSM